MMELRQALAHRMQEGAAGVVSQPCTCPPSTWHKWQQKSEVITRRATSWARRGYSQLPGSWGLIYPNSPVPHASLPQGLCSCHFLC